MVANAATKPNKQAAPPNILARKTIRRVCLNESANWFTTAGDGCSRVVIGSLILILVRRELSMCSARSVAAIFAAYSLSALARERVLSKSIGMIERPFERNKSTSLGTNFDENILGSTTTTKHDDARTARRVSTATSPPGANPSGLRSKKQVSFRLFSSVARNVAYFPLPSQE